MTDNDDEKMLARAQEIQSERGVSLVDAMIAAEAELSPEPTVPGEFTITVPVKPRVARWVQQQFPPTRTHTTEQRLGAYVAIVLNRVRVSSMRMAEEPPEIGEGSAVTMTRQRFQERAPKS